MDERLNTAPCGFLVFADDGTVLEINATLLAMLRYERVELCGHHLQQLLPPGGRVFYQTHFFPLLKLQGEVEEIYLSLRTKDAADIPFLANARRREIAGNAVYDCVFVRMRQRSHFEAELLNAKKAAQRANKAKDEFLATLSHELRTPLSPVLMMATAMELDPALTPAVREQAALIRRNAELEAHLIDDLLDITRITHGKLKLVPGAVDVHTLLDQTEEIVKSDVNTKRVSIRFTKTAKEHHVRGDATRLQQVFWNLIKNAVKFTPAGGEIRVVTENEPTGRLTVRVIDSGIGIAAEVLPRIFNAFEQGSISTQRFGGLGLGLAITKALVEMHNGVIRAMSAGHGCGATFLVELATVAPPAPVPEITAPVLALQTGGLRLLLVEDHDSTREVLAKILQSSGHQVVGASTGAEALALAESAGPFDVIISDLGLPDQSGYDLMRTLQARRHVPAIALSGYGLEEDIRKAKAAGFTAHLVKPVAFEQLRSLLEHVALGNPAV